MKNFCNFLCLHIPRTSQLQKNLQDNEERIY